MEWLGYNTVASLVEQKIKETAIKNPGPMRSMSVRIPIGHEARLIVLSEMLGTPKSTLLRDLLMSALLEAEHKLFEDVFETEEDRSEFLGRVEKYREALEEGADYRTGDPEISAEIQSVRAVGEKA